MGNDVRDVSIAQIQIDAGTQVRVKVREEMVSDYADDMQRGDQFPPVVLFHDGSGYSVGDGIHRVLAASRIGRAEITAEVHKGTAKDALWFALGANKKHGMRLHLDDKRHAIELALKTWGEEKSSAMIADQIGCSDVWVGKIRNQVQTSSDLMPNSASIKESKKRVKGKDGKSYPAKRSHKACVHPMSGPRVLTTSEDTQCSSIGMVYAESAIRQLEKIALNDTERNRALITVRDWCDQSLQTQKEIAI